MTVVAAKISTLVGLGFIRNPTAGRLVRGVSMVRRASIGVIHAPGSIMGKHENDQVQYEDIERAAERIRPFVHHTPTLTCTFLDELSGKNLFFKCENFQKTGSFKLRGAVNTLLRLKEFSNKDLTAVTHSSGNHGQALALAAKLQRMEGKIVMPNIAPESKKSAVKGYGATLHECAPSEKGRVDMCQDLLNELKGKGEYIPSADHPFIMEGQGTIAIEMLKDTPDLDAVMIACSAGGMVGGMSVACKRLKPDMKVFACEPDKADDLARSFASGKREILTDYPDTIADGLRMSVGIHTWPVIKDNVETSILVSEEEIIDAMYLLWERMKIVVEPSGAVPLAAILSKQFRSLSKDLKNIGIVVCGGNTDLHTIPWMKNE